MDLAVLPDVEFGEVQPQRPRGAQRPRQPALGDPLAEMPAQRPVDDAEIGEVLSGAAALADNDGHGFFAALGDQVVTSPTLTNVNDFRAVLVG